MSAALLDELQILRTDKGVRWVLPMRSTMHPFRGPWLTRAGSWACILIGVFCIGCGAGASAMMWAKMRGCFPLDPLNACLLAAMSFGALICVVPPFVMGFVSIVLGFPAHTEYSLSADYLEETQFNGWFRWRRRIRVGDIARLAVHTPPTASRRALQRSLDERRASLVVECAPSGKTRQLGWGHSHRIMTQLVAGLSQELSARRTDPVTVLFTSTPDVITPGVVDTMDRAYLDADEPIPPAGCVYELCPQREGLLITSPPAVRGFIQLLRQPFFRFGVWPLGLGVAAYLFLPKIPFAMPPDVQVVVAVYCWGLGGILLLLSILGFRLHYTYRVTPHWLERTWHCLGLHWTWRVARSGIVAMRIAYRHVDNGRVRSVLEMVGPDGRKRDLVWADVASLRFLGTHLRWALQVPASLVVADGLDPQHAANDVQDQAGRLAR